MGRQFIMPGQLFLGEGALADCAKQFCTLGKKAFIVTDETMVSLGNVDILTKELTRENMPYAVFPGIGGEPTDKMIEAGLQSYRDEKCDFFIALGGGSPIDSMKAIAALTTNPGKISDYMGKIFPNPAPPMAAIPTTAGTGSEATQFTIITDTQKDIKMLLKGTVLIPQIAVIDPVFTLTAPPKITAATGLDALTHAVESYTSRRAQAMTDTFALSAIKRIFTYLPICFHKPGDKNAREQMAIAALEGGVCINNASVTLVHGMSRPIGAMFHVPHGISNAMLLETCLSFAIPGAPEKFADIAKAIGAAKESDSPAQAAEAFLKALRELCRELKIPTLQEYGIKKEDYFAVIEKMAKDAVDSGSPANTIREVGVDDVAALYRQLWN
jgi:alcohol dehydrogenase class IV